MVASFDFAESEILAEIYALALEGRDFAVERRLRLGKREEAVKPALERGEVDLVPEYLGSALEVGFGGTPSADVRATWQALADAFGAVGVTVLDPSPAQNTNGVVVTAETAAALGLRAISDLVAVAPDLVFGGSPECPQRPRCLLGLTSLYGIEFGEFVALDVGGPLTAAALESGDIDVAMLFSTDGTIAAEGWVLLEDDRGLQPAENIVPVIRADALAAWGDGVAGVLNAISALLRTDQLTELNRRVGFGGETPQAVARDWLATRGLLLP